MKRNILITGGAGFIGTNAARHFMEKGHRVTILDNLSRKGAEQNLSWLKNRHKNFAFKKIDMRDYRKLKNLFKQEKKIDTVLHLAGQVAVTSSITDPRNDFESNILGTFNLLEAIRETYGLSPAKRKKSPFVIFASTNKVYGGMENVKIIEKGRRYAYRHLTDGIPEKMPLDFHSPYGCSNGAADQYVIDYSRIYNMETVSFRQSCIYGYRQFGMEDQGWVAWFIIAAVLGKRITIYGDGKQVRDILFVDDLVRAYEVAMENRRKVSGKAYNIGGGIKNTLSLLELLSIIEELLGKKVRRSFGKRRPGDQLVFICDIQKAKKEFGWSPKIGVGKGVANLFRWVSENSGLFEGF